MTDLLCASDYTPEPGLFPIEQSQVHFQIGEKVAFREDHESHGTAEPNDADQSPRPARYGLIRAIGVTEEGLALDLLVLDQSTGEPLDGEPIHRATLGELQ